MEQTRAGYWTAAIFFAALLLIMALLAPLVPGLPFIGGLILIFYLPVLCVQYGLAVALILAAGPALVLAFMASPVLAALQWGIPAAASFAVGAGYSRHVAPVRIFGFVTGGIIALSLLSCLGLIVIGQVPLYDMLQQIVNEAADEAVAYYIQSNPASAQIIAVHQEVEMLKKAIPVMVPLQICLGILMTVYLQIRVTQPLLARKGYDIPPFPPIRLWEIPRAMVYLYILAMVMKYWRTSRHIDWLNMMAVNADQLASFFICIEGLAFMLYLLQHRFVLKSATQAMIVILVLFVPIFQIAAFIFGLADMLLNYRKKREAM